MEPIPDVPLFVIVTDEEMTALKAAKGGHITEYGTAEQELFEQLADRGWVQEVSETGAGMAWKLSGDGLKLAYGGE